MSQDQESKPKGWWQTLPGLLTAVATVVTAVTGLLVALHQAGCLARGTQPAVSAQSEPHPIGAGSAASSPSTGVAASESLAIPANAEVYSEQAVYQLLSARLVPYSPEKVSLHFAVRMTNKDEFDLNFWAASFRLAVNGSLQSPTNNLDEIVPAHGAKEGDVEFVVPANVSTVGLQMGDVGVGKPTITIQLQHN